MSSPVGTFPAPNGMSGPFAMWWFGGSPVVILGHQQLRTTRGSVALAPGQCVCVRSDWFTTAPIAFVVSHCTDDSCGGSPLVSSLLRGVAEKTGFAMMHNAINGKVVTDLHQAHNGGSANQTVYVWTRMHESTDSVEGCKATQQWNAVRGTARGVHEDQHSGACHDATPACGVGCKIITSRCSETPQRGGLCEDLPMLMNDLFLHLLMLGRLGNASRHTTWFCGALLAAPLLTDRSGNSGARYS